MPRVDKYRGKEKAELAGISMKDALPLLTSRARRNLVRAMTKTAKIKQLYKKAAHVKATNPAKVIKTQIREAVILPEWLDLIFSVHDGKTFRNVHITVDKLGYRLGDFAHTTSRVLHSGPGVGATRGSKFIPLK